MEFIASGGQADIYRIHNDYMAVKLFRQGVQKEIVEYEMNLQKKAYELGLPVPEIYNLVEIDGKHGIVMEYIDGVTIGKIICESKKTTYQYLIKAIELQIHLNNIITSKFPSMAEKLIENISKAALLDIDLKQNLLEKINKIKFNQYLCHGDFHVYNLIETAKGKIVIVDWIDSKTGNSEFDVCRSYILYKESSDEIAKMYIENYCKMTNILREDILVYAPIVAAARLGENIQDRHKIDVLMKLIKEGK